MDISKLIEFAENKKKYRNHGTKNLARLMIDILQQPSQITNATPVVVQVMEPVVASEKPMEEVLKPVVSEPLSEVDELEEYSEDVALSEADTPPPEEPQKEVSKEDLVRIGSYDYTMPHCQKCDNMREGKRLKFSKENGVSVQQYNYFDITCKDCTKKRFNSFVGKKKDMKAMEKAKKKNEIRKSETRTLDDKISQLEKVKKARSKETIDKKAFKKDLKNAVEKNSSFNLNLYV